MSQPGDVLGGRYTLQRTAWTSPLGPVWSARDRVLDRAVLVQLLEENLAANTAARRAFQKTAARVAQATHPGVLQVYDIGDQPAFVVFEYAGGGRLSDRIASGALRPTEAARAALAIARGLEALHEQGLWLGTLSPACVHLDREGRAKIMAAGVIETLAKAPALEAAAEQPPGYRPPEKDPLPGDADRYALAALTYHMLTGRAPMGAPARSINRKIPAAIDTLLERSLSPDPHLRPTLDEFAGALAPFARVSTSERGPRFSASEFRWLAAVVVILALGAVAATFGVQFARQLAERSDKERAPAKKPAAEASPLTVQAVDDFDPFGRDPEEHPERTSRAIDQDPRTAWRTVGYRTAAFGGKSGVGLVFDLGGIHVLRRVRVQSTLPGWSAEIRVADVPGARPDDFKLAADLVAATDGTVTLPTATKGRFVLLWITKLVDDGGGSEFPFRAEVAEVELSGT